MEGEEPFPLPDLGAAAASMAASVSQLSQSQTLMTSQSPRQPMLAGVPRSLFAVEPASLSQSQALSKSGLDQPAPGQASLLRDSSWQRNSQAVGTQCMQHIILSRLQHNQEVRDHHPHVYDFQSMSRIHAMIMPQHRPVETPY